MLVLFEADVGVVLLALRYGRHVRRAHTVRAVTLWWIIVLLSSGDDIASEFIYDEFRKNDGKVRDRETYDDVI